MIHLIITKAILIYKTPRIKTFLNHSLGKKYGDGLIALTDFLTLTFLSVLSLTKVIQVASMAAAYNTKVIVMIPSIILTFDSEASTSTFCGFLFLSFKRLSSNIERLSMELQNLFFVDSSQLIEQITSEQSTVTMQEFTKGNLLVGIENNKLYKSIHLAREFVSVGREIKSLHDVFQIPLFTILIIIQLQVRFFFSTL